MRQVLELGKAFDRLFFSCEMGCSKPDPAHFTLLIESLNLAPETPLFSSSTIWKRTGGG
jgi:FMN phosphatase YigB (HAD superfamily)